MILNLDEYNKWVNTKYNEFISSDDGFRKYYDFNNAGARVSVCDFKTQRFEVAEQKEIPEGIDDIQTYDVMLAIAWAKLNGEEIPTLDTEPQRWRADENDNYYFADDRGYSVCMNDIRSVSDNDHFETGNYFKTRERANQVAEKIKFLLKLEQFHDVYCPEYVPNWNAFLNDTWIVYYSYASDKYMASPQKSTCRLISYVYFPTEEIAQKVCDILNEELNVEDTTCKGV